MAPSAPTTVGMFLLGGGIQANRHRSYTVTVDPARFRSDVGAAMGTVEEALAAQLKADLAVP